MTRRSESLHDDPCGLGIRRPARRSPGWRPRSVALVVGGLVCLWVSFATAGPSTLAARLDKQIARAPLGSGAVGMLVVRASDGAVVYARGADRPLVPASNQKILTALAALDRFGPSHRFATRIWAPAALDADGTVASLLVEGGGDPVMNSEDWWRIAADLRREGLRLVRGDLRVDDTRFDPPGWHPSWGRISSRAYHAPVGALTANYGAFFVSVWPRSAVGDPVRVDVDPPVDYLRVRNRATTVARGRPPRLSIDRAAGPAGEGAPDEVIRVDGAARVGEPVDRFPRSVRDPGLYAGSLLARQLEANGVAVEGDVRRSPRQDEPLTLLLEHRGRTISESVMLCMKYSNNSIAESLIKNLGAWQGVPEGGEPTRQGEWVGGVRALREQLSGAGLDLAQARLVDGSGLSVSNRLTPRQLVRALDLGRRSFRYGPEFMAALPIAERDGTLEKRLDGGQGRIRAKTGLLSDAKVTALSGYAERADGDMLIFSIIVNGHSGGSGGAMDAVDRLAATLLDAPLPPSTGSAPAAPVGGPARSASAGR